MAIILEFPGKRSKIAIRIRSKQKHRVSVRITDRKRPKRTRWYTQFGVQRASSFRGLKGFTDVSARRHQWHAFEVDGRWRTRRFLLDVEEFLLAGRIEVKVDGFAVTTTRIRVAA